EHRLAPGRPTTVPIAGPWADALTGRERVSLERALPSWLPSRRWFAGKERVVRSARIAATIPIGESITLLLLSVAYDEADPETYALPVSISEDTARIENDAPHAVVAWLARPGADAP